MKKGNPEGHIQLQILHYLRAKGYVCGKTKTMGVRRGNVFFYDPFTFRGYPDISCFANNKLYFIEVKSPKGVQSQEQKNFQFLCDEAGIYYILARKLEDVSSII
jgi:hypothetical protein